MSLVFLNHCSVEILGYLEKMYKNAFYTKIFGQIEKNCQ